MEAVRSKKLIATLILSSVILIVCKEIQARIEVRDLLHGGKQGTEMADGRMPPINITAEALSDTELNISWFSPPEQPDFYRVKLVDPYVNEDVYETWFVISSLDPCSIYKITVASEYDGGKDEYPGNTYGQTNPSPPPPPENCTIDQITSTSMYIHLEEPETPCRITNYGLNWTYDVLWSDEVGVGEDTAVGTNYLITSLIPYTNYSFSIAAATEAGYGGQLHCSAVQTTEDVPGPVDVTDIIQGNESATVVWMPPEDANGILQQYQIILAYNGTDIVKTTGPEHQSVIVSPLTPCENYTASVTAQTSVGWGTSGVSPTFVLINNVPPAKVTCSVVDQSTLDVYWEPDTKDCPVSQYLVAWTGQILWKNQTESSSLSVDGNTNTFYVQLDGLTPYTNYSVCVNVGQDVYGPCSSCVTLEDAPSAPYLEELHTSANTISVSWTEPEVKNGLLTGYLLRWSNSQGTVASITTDSSTFFHTILKLAWCDTYTVTVQAGTEGGGWGNHSNARQANITNSISDQGLHCSGEDSRTSFTTWGLVAEDCSVSAFLLDWSSSALWYNQTVSGHTTISGTESSYTLVGLEPYSQFKMCISIQYSQEDPVCCLNTTNEEAASAPTSLTVTKETETSISVSWSLPERLNGRLTNWYVNCSQGKDAKLDAQVRSHTFTGLTSGTTYIITVMAVNGAGLGEAAEETGSTHPGHTQPIALTIGLSVGGGLLLLLLVVVGVYYTRRKLYSKNTRTSPTLADKYKPTGMENEGMDREDDTDHDSYSHDMYKKQQKSYRDQRYWSEKIHGKVDFDVSLWSEDVTDSKSEGDLDVALEMKQAAKGVGSRIMTSYDVDWPNRRGDRRYSHYRVNDLAMPNDNLRRY